LAKARGKIILLGEHAVVYGRPALVVGIENGAKATVHLDQSSSIDVGGHKAVPGEGELGRAYQALLQNLNAPGLRAVVDLGIPAGCGLGASAAVGVALARAVLDLLHTEGEMANTDDRVLRAAHVWETVFHGKPSGIDASAATLGGCFVYTKDQKPDIVHLSQPLMLAVAVADKPANTRTMVEKVAAQLARAPERTQEIFESIGSLVTSAKGALAQGNVAALGPLMNRNHALLRELSVSTEPLDQACDVALLSGAIGAKLTGSGGGGCVVALSESTTEPVLRAWKARGVTCFQATIHPQTNSPAL